MQAKVILILIFCVLICPPSIRADYDAYTYMVYAGTRRTIGWTAAPEADGYEIIVRRMESGKDLYKGTVTDTQITIKFSTTGHNVIYLRAFKGSGAARDYSEWITSIDPSFAMVNSVPKAWVMAVHTY